MRWFDRMVHRLRGRPNGELEATTQRIDRREREVIVAVQEFEAEMLRARMEALRRAEELGRRKAS